MSRTSIHRVEVAFGDCDPAGIVFFPNFSRWMDQASLVFFRTCGVPSWRELEAERSIVGTPLLEIQTQFRLPATYGDVLEIRTTVDEWNERTFLQRHVVMRGSDTICEGTELRAFCVRRVDLPGRLRTIPIPEDIRVLCS